jgi:hypothetical protein
MKNSMKFLPIMLLLIGLSACNNGGKLPTVVTGQATVNTTQKTVVCEGYVETAGEGAVIDRGICYVKGEGTPTLADRRVSGGDGIGSFECTLENIDAVDYNYCAYAVNSAGTAYGRVRSFNGAKSGGNGGEGGEGGQGGGGEQSNLPTSYIKQGDQVTTLTSANSTISYNYAVNPSFWSGRVIRFYSQNGLEFFIVTHTLVQLTTIDLGVWTYSTTWNYSPTVYHLWYLFGTQHESSLVSFSVSMENGLYVVDAQIDNNTTLHYKGAISISFN